jgi:hypothetical protein
MEFFPVIKYKGLGVWLSDRAHEALGSFSSTKNQICLCSLSHLTEQYFAYAWEI